VPKSEHLIPIPTFRIKKQMLLLFILLYLAATVAIGWFSARYVKDTNDFVVGGRKMPLMVVASGLFATWFGSETVLGASTKFTEKGLIGVVEDPFGAALCLFLVGVLLAKPLYKLNLLTFSDYFKQRFGQNVERVSAFMIVPSYLGWIAAQLIALATILHVVTGLAMPIGILICAFLVMFYTYIGGMWAVSITDFVQTIIIIIGMLILTILMVQKVGGLSILLAKTPDGFFNILPKAGFKNSVEYFVAWITVGLGSVPQQDVFQRIMSAKNEQTAIRGAYLSSAMYLSVAMLPLLIALCGKILYPELLVGNEATKQMLIPKMVLQHGGLGLQILFFGALMSAILSTASGAILAPATVIGENIIKSFNKNITDNQLLKAMRWSVVGVTLASVVFTMFNESIYELVAQSSAISLVSLFVPLIFGLYWKKATDFGAMSAIIGGFVIWICANIFKTEYPSVLYGLLGSAGLMIICSYISVYRNK
jgi:SSS family transporter